jgi:hypothetical protein
MSSQERFARAFLTLKAAFGPKPAWDMWRRLAPPSATATLAKGDSAAVEKLLQQKFDEAWAAAAAAAKTKRAQQAAKKKPAQVWLCVCVCLSVWRAWNCCRVLCAAWCILRTCTRPAASSDTPTDTPPRHTLAGVARAHGRQRLRVRGGHAAGRAVVVPGHQGPGAAAAAHGLAQWADEANP